MALPRWPARLLVKRTWHLGLSASSIAGLLFGAAAGWWNHVGQEANSSFSQILYASGFLCAAMSMRSLLTMVPFMLPTLALWMFGKYWLPEIEPSHSIVSAHCIRPMPYNILHVIPYMHPSAGGPPVVVENFISRGKSLRPPLADHFDTELLQRRREQFAEAPGAACSDDFSDRLETLPVLSRSGAAKINAHVRRADIVHVHTLWSPLNVSARYACLRHDRPYVLMPHGMLDPYSLSVKALKKSIYLQLFERHNIACAQRMIYTTLRGGATGGLGRLAVAARRTCPAWRERKLCFERRPARSIFGEISSSRRKANVALSRTTPSQKGPRSHPELLAISSGSRSRMCF